MYGFKWIKPKYFELCILAFIILIGLVLRIHNISAKELWYDEAFSADIIRNSYIDVFKLSKTDVHPPLFYFVLKAWTHNVDSELMLRLPSVIFGVGLIPLAYYLVLYISKNVMKANLVALVIAVNPFLVTYSKEARSNSMLAFLTVLGFFLFLKAYKDKKYLAISILLPILFLTHYITVFIIGLFVIVLVINDKRAFKFMLLVIIVMILWMPMMIGNSNNSGLTWIPEFSLSRVPQSFQAFIFGVDTSDPQLPPPTNPFPFGASITATISFIIALGLILIPKKSTDHYLLLAFALIPIFLTALVGKIFNYNLYVERYLIGYAALLVVYFVIVLPKRANPLVFIYLILSVFTIYNQQLVNIGYKELGSFKSDKLIVMTSATDFINAKYYSDDIKLQQGDWSDWGIIKQSDIFNIDENKEEFYLVNRGPLIDSDWKPKIIIGEFYFYEWK